MLSLTVSNEPTEILDVHSENARRVLVFAAISSSCIDVSASLIYILPAFDRSLALCAVVTVLVLLIEINFSVSPWRFGDTLDRVRRHLILMAACLAFFDERVIRNSAVIAFVKTLVYNIYDEAHFCALRAQFYPI